MKITFDPNVPDMAFVAVPGRTRKCQRAGRWIVFREHRLTAGICHEDILFASPHIEDCHHFITDATNPAA